MKKLAFLCILISFTFTGCIDIIEEIFLNKNGSGVYSITMDASGIMEGGGLRSMMEMAGSQVEGGQEMPELEGPIEVDTVMYFKDAPAELVQGLEHPDLLDQISIHQQISEEKEIMKTIFTLDFNDVSEIDKFLKDFPKLGGQNDEMGALSELMGGIMFGKTVNDLPLFSSAKKMLTRAKTEVPKMDEDNDESMQMMQMMLADAAYKLIYHLPGNVKKTNLQNARVEGKDIFVEVNLLDSMKGDTDLSGYIKYKNK